MFPDCHWYAATPRDPRVIDLFSRHYSSAKNHAARESWALRGIAGPGEQMTLLTSDARAAWIWRVQRYRADGRAGVECYFFRNESPILSSALIAEAVTLARRRWGDVPMFTFVNPLAVASANPGYCFQCAGWRRAGRTASGLLVFEL